MTSAPRTSSAWRPLLDGPIRQAALKAVQEIAGALENPDRTFAALSKAFPRPDHLHRIARASVSGGCAGTALLHAYVARSELDDRAEKTAWIHLDMAIEGLSQAREIPPGLFAGFTGVAWATRHLHHVLDGTSSGEATRQIDDLLDHLLKRPWHYGFDLMNGLIGIGVYALERLPDDQAERWLETIVDELSRTAEREQDGIAWRTPPDLVPASYRSLVPAGYHDLGLAHGIPGVISFLSRVHQAGIAVEEAGALLDGAVPWLLRQERVEPPRQRFGYWAGNPLKERVDRAGWCYGDPGVAIALLAAGRARENRDWEERGLRLARDVAQRPPEQLGLDNPGLCHGVAGTAHILNCLWQSTGDHSCRDASRFWLARALEMRRPGDGCAGYSIEVRDEANRTVGMSDGGFLMGAAGIGLALLAAATSVEPEWDRLLLLSSRSGHGADGTVPHP